MKMVVLTSDLFQQALNRLSECRLPMAAAIKLRDINNIVLEKGREYHQARFNCLEKLAEKDESGRAVIENDSFRLSEENLKIAQEEISALLEQEVITPRLKLSELTDLKELTISQHELAFLDSILEY